MKNCKICNARRESNAGSALFNYLIKRIPDSVIEKLNTKELTRLVDALYQQRLDGMVENYAMFVDVIKSGIETEKKTKEEPSHARIEFIIDIYGNQGRGFLRQLDVLPSLVKAREMVEAVQPVIEKDGEVCFITLVEYDEDDNEICKVLLDE